MTAYFVTLIIGATVMMAMFAAAFAAKYDAQRDLR